MTASHLGRPRRLRYHDLAREGVRHLTLRVILHTYPKRAILGGSLMIMQSFPYNAIFFSYALVLAKFYHVNSNMAPLCGLEPSWAKRQTRSGPNSATCGEASSSSLRPWTPCRAGLRAPSGSGGPGHAAARLRRDLGRRGVVTLDACPIADEKPSDEIGTPLFTRTVIQALAVATEAATVTDGKPPATLASSISMTRTVTTAAYLVTEDTAGGAKALIWLGPARPGRRHRLDVRVDSDRWHGRAGRLAHWRDPARHRPVAALAVRGRPGGGQVSRSPHKGGST